MRKPITFIVPLVVYPFDVMVSINESNDNIVKLLKKYNVDYSDVDVQQISETRKGRTILFKGNQTLIRMFDFDESPVSYGNLQHEIFHAIEFIMDRIGQKLTFDSDESYAYAIGYLTTEIYKKL